MRLNPNAPGADRLREKGFENIVEAVLLAGGPDAIRAAEPWNPLQRADGPYTPGGYRKRAPGDYDRTLCLDTVLLVEFLQTSQPEAWATLEKTVGGTGEARAAVARDVNREIAAHGLIKVLRNPLRIEDVPFYLAYFLPASTLNPDEAARCGRNIFSVVRQLKYTTRSEKSLDMALFLNGIPFATLELKNNFNGQSVDDAVRQYREDRDPKEPLFAARRCAVHFAVDNQAVRMTSELAGAETRFLPFDTGRDGGAGNPALLDNYPTAHLWEQTLARDSVLNLLQHFVYEKDESRAAGDTRRRTGKRLLFPRYHQLNVVRRLMEDCRTHGAGRKYLIQHSAGSGKSNSIAWLAHQLSTLHDAGNRRVFTDVLVITDRVNLDTQLKETVTGFERTLGTVRGVKTSAQLADALAERVPIVVTTLQKFPHAIPHILDQVEKAGERRFALIIDEAHSSQGGEASRDMNRALRETAGTYGNAAASAETPDAARERAEFEAARLSDAADADLSEGESLDAVFVREAEARGELKNASYFAFTATPKPATRNRFGTLRPDGSYEAFDTYSMRQAIEEGFILDVLRNYITYAEFFNLAQRTENDPIFEKERATRLLTAFARSHPTVIKEKVAAMLGHFEEVVQGTLQGQARAMIVTSSRLEALRYHLAAEEYLKERSRPYRTLVAFSGEVKDGGNREEPYTEAGVNGFPDKQTPAKLKEDPYRILIVANKYQTGYDEPLLCGLYLDKKLAGVAAVQTLSRLNRTYPGKTGVWVLDFANAPTDIQDAFQTYYDRAILERGTDPRLLTDLQRRLRDFGLYDDALINEVLTYFRALENGEPGHSLPGLSNLIQTRLVAEFAELEEERRISFAKMLTDFIRLYGFLSQVLRSADGSLEKLYHFARIVRPELPALRESLSDGDRAELLRAAIVSRAGVMKTGEHQLTLKGGVAHVNPQGAKLNSGAVEVSGAKRDPLSVILAEINDRFGIPQENARPFVLELLRRIGEDVSLRHTFATNASPQERKLVFTRRAGDLVQDMLSVNFEMYKQVNDNPDFAEGFLQFLLVQYEAELGDK